jgi:cell division protein FtsB
MAVRQGIRWDRLGRCALLGVLALVVYLYIGPAANWVSTWQESKQRKAQVAKLEASNAALRERRAQLRDPATLETEARRLGMVRAGEKAYVVSGLPDD